MPLSNLPAEYISPYQINNMRERIRYRRFIALLKASHSLHTYAEDFAASYNINHGWRNNNPHTIYNDPKFYNEGPFNALGYWATFTNGENYKMLECVFQALETMSMTQTKDSLNILSTNFSRYESNLMSGVDRFAEFPSNNLRNLYDLVEKNNIFEVIEEKGLKNVYQLFGWHNRDGDIEFAGLP